MTTKRKQGAYYLAKSRKYYESLGWKTQKLEINIPFFIKGKVLFSRKDLFGADMAIWKENEKNSFTLVQVKSTDGERSGAIADVRLKAKKQFDEENVPLPKQIIIWQIRKKPIIESYN